MADEGGRLDNVGGSGVEIELGKVQLAMKGMGSLIRWLQRGIRRVMRGKGMIKGMRQRRLESSLTNKEKRGVYDVNENRETKNTGGVQGEG